MAGPPNQERQLQYDFGSHWFMAVFVVWGWLAVGAVLVGQEIAPTRFLRLYVFAHFISPITDALLARTKSSVSHLLF